MNEIQDVFDREYVRPLEAQREARRQLVVARLARRRAFAGHRKGARA